MENTGPKGFTRRRILKTGGELVTVTILASSGVACGLYQETPRVTFPGGNGGATRARPTGGETPSPGGGQTPSTEGGSSNPQTSGQAGAGQAVEQLPPDAPANAVEPGSPLARQLEYVLDAERAERRTNADAYCYNCIYWRGPQDQDWAPCQLFGGDLVAQDGWCISWAPMQ